MTRESAPPSNSDPLPAQGVPLPQGFEALISIATNLHAQGLSPAEIKAALKKALELHRAKGKAST